ncbi:MAG: hypothetical protein ACK559_32450, partial [bacterium]
ALSACTGAGWSSPGHTDLQPAGAPLLARGDRPPDLARHREHGRLRPHGPVVLCGRPDAEHGPHRLSLASPAGR